VSIARWVLALVVAGHLSQASAPVHAQSPKQSNPVLKPAKERASNPRMGLQGDAPNAEQTPAQPLAKCIADWQATSNMTKEEWRHTCERAQNKDTSGRNALSVCIADWDAATHMSKREWRNACLRSVKEDPTAFR
jgi:hypothetical protein